MTFFRSYDDDPLALLPEPAAKTLERHRLARAGRASDPPVSVGVFVVIVGIQKDRRSVVEVQTEEDTVVVTQLVGGKGKGRSNARSQGIAPGLALNVGVKRQDRERRKERLLVL